MTRTNALPCIDIGWKLFKVRYIYSTVVWCNSVKDNCKQGGATVEGNDWNMYANKEDYQYPTFTNAVKY